MNDAFNYVAVLVSIVVGLTATRVMSGLGEMIQAANRPRIYWVHILWHITLLFQVMLNWWLLYRWRATPEWTFLLFIWITVAPIILYLAAAILIPGELETTGSPDWRDYYYKNRRGFFFAIGSIAPLDIIDTLLKGWRHFLDQGPTYLPFIAFWTIGCAIAAICDNERYHKIWAILFPSVQVIYTLILLLHLS
jgi:hypothetical protein